MYNSYCFIIVRYRTTRERIVNVCTDLTACSIVRYCTACVSIANICVQMLQFVLLYGTVLQEYELLKYVYSSYILFYCTLLIAGIFY